MNRARMAWHRVNWAHREMNDIRRAVRVGVIERLEANKINHDLAKRGLGRE